MKKFISFCLKIGISSTLIWYLIEKHGDELYQQVSNIDIYWIAVALICMTASNLLGSIQWNLILRNIDISLPLKRTLAFYYTGLFFNNFLLSFVGGDVMRIYDISKSSERKSEAVSTVLLDRLIGLVTLCLFAVAATLYTVGSLSSKYLAVIVLSIFLLISLTVFFFYSKSFAKKFEAVGRRILPEKIVVKIGEIYNAINYYRGRIFLLIWPIVISVFVQSLRIIVHYFTAKALGFDVEVVYFFLIIPIIALVITLPVSIGGIGLREYFGALLFPFAGISSATGVIVETLAYIVNIICSLPGAISFVFRKHEMKERVLT